MYNYFFKYQYFYKKIKLNTLFITLVIIKNNVSLPLL